MTESSIRMRINHNKSRLSKDKIVNSKRIPNIILYGDKKLTKDKDKIEWYHDFIDRDYTPKDDELVCLFYFEKAAEKNQESQQLKSHTRSKKGEIL